MLGEVTRIDHLAAVGGILACAESVGAAAAVFDLAREYAGQRRQFGHTIASFQALRHLLAEMHVKVESSWSSVIYAAASLDEDATDALQTASIAKAYAARATRDVAHGALQVFGGIAFTAEHPAHRYLRRIIVRGGQFGTRRRARALARTQPSDADRGDGMTAARFLPDYFARLDRGDDIMRAARAGLHVCAALVGRGRGS